jgi:hypothetical protein
MFMDQHGKVSSEAKLMPMQAGWQEPDSLKVVCYFCLCRTHVSMPAWFKTTEDRYKMNRDDSHNLNSASCAKNTFNAGLFSKPGSQAFQQRLAVTATQATTRHHHQTLVSTVCFVQHS